MVFSQQEQQRILHQFYSNHNCPFENNGTPEYKLFKGFTQDNKTSEKNYDTDRSLRGKAALVTALIETSKKFKAGDLQEIPAENCLTFEGRKNIHEYSLFLKEINFLQTEDINII